MYTFTYVCIHAHMCVTLSAHVYTIQTKVSVLVLFPHSAHLLCPSQALTAGDHLNSKPSEPLVMTWPGTRAPQLRRIPSVSSSSLRVSWTAPYLTDGVKVKHFRVSAGVRHVKVVAEARCLKVSGKVTSS